MMISRFIKLLFLGINLFATTHARIYVTHGFNASHTTWYQPGGDFYEALKIVATNEGHSIEHFSWEQKYLGYFNSEHLLAGVSLATKIINFCHGYTYNPLYPNDREIIVIAHSYGGLVSYNASQTLANFLAQVEKKDSLQYQGIMGWFKKAWSKFAQTWAPSMPKPVISKLCTLGTPHRESDILPHPQGVRVIYNLFSLADWVAYEPVAGKPLLPQNLLTQHNAAYNIQMFGSSDDIIHGFGHSEMHHPSIATNIFDIINTADEAAMQKPAPKNIPYTVIIPEEKPTAIPAKKIVSTPKIPAPLPQHMPRTTLVSATTA